MADITISDLELAPALTDDMVLPVENTTDTYAATLAMLRRLINKTFVEVENADFNALTDDGFYQCTGTPTNSPVAGAINWTLQVSAESGVVVQRAFSLDDNFANLYIRRWNGVTWTAWLNIGKGALDNKANVSNTVTTDTVQTITTSKNINVGGTGAYGRSFEIMMPTSTESNPTENKTREIAFLASEGAGERYEGSLTHSHLTTGESYTGLRAGRLLNGTYKEGSLGVRIIADGTTFGTAPSTPANPAGVAIVTVDYVKNNYVDKTSNQTISGSKRFIPPSAGMSIELVADTNQQTIPSAPTLRQMGIYRNSTYTKGDGYTCWVQGYRGSDGLTEASLYARRFLESDSQEIVNYVRINITPDGIPICYTRTPPVDVVGEEIVTAGWFNSKMQVVSALPANPDPNVFYFIPE